VKNASTAVPKYRPFACAAEASVAVGLGVVSWQNDCVGSCAQVFGPVVVVNPVDTVDEAIERANGTRFGLQAGVFTASLETALRAAEHLDFGGITVNEAPTFRSDQMPYGGVKASGNTREGPAYAVHEMTEEHLVVIQR